MDGWTYALLLLIDRKLNRVLALLGEVQKESVHMAGELDALTKQVAENTDAEKSAIVLLDNLHALLVAAGTDPAKLQALKDTLATSKAEIVAAVVRNTPVGPTPP